MDSKNVAVGVLIFFTFTMLGGLLGIFVGDSLCDRAQVQSYAAYSQQETDEDTEEALEEVEELPPIEIANLNDLNHVLDLWKEIVLRTSQGNLERREASRIIYTMSSEIYKRNIPEEFCLYRLKNIIVDNGQGQLKELTYSNITYDGEEIAYVDVTENYENITYAYKLKFVKENNNWCFAAQLEG
ncbi:hypothetical protein [Crassaminicella indica]|uniref:ARC6 IMS domain-containing protein n=1 Tax=Crassaminicella indica TaxID=2855394 RepID=A0ABX8RBM2_9CLOT|nr:hypothetical protein [Crassaminicella indica]QXM06423.1 hypothetical protein KVH43_01215 [Crassaminicella indica]